MAEATAQLPSLAKTRRSESLRPRPAVTLGLALLIPLLGLLHEARTARLQAALFTRVAASARATLGEGPSETIAFPRSGPHDLRHGYGRIPELVARLEARGYQVERQMQWSPGLRALHAAGLAGPFRESGRRGLVIADDSGELLFDARGAPGYAELADVPPVVVATLLFIEDRHLLDAHPPSRNPAVEWDRLARALAEHAFLGDGPGGSTLATQLEKVRHSPGGRTHSPAEKIRQMLSASIRAYRDGPDTWRAREALVVDYLNALPLGGTPPLGEVIGLDRGLAAWFDADPSAVDRALQAVSSGGEVDAEAALAYRRVLALLLATRRPSALLVGQRAELEWLADGYLEMLAREGIVRADLARAAQGLPLGFGAATARVDRLVERKPAAPVRARLAHGLGVEGYPALDALDLRVTTTLDASAQRAAHELLRSIAQPEAARARGLVGPRLLAAGDDTAQVVWSFSLHRADADANRVLVHVDSGDAPLDVQAGVRLDLGSTAKLRTLLLYLSLVAELHEGYADLDAAALAERAATARAARDALGAWVAETLAAEPAIGLDALLERALERRYAASSAERFFTGGGVHRFRNFGGAHEGSWLSVRVAFRDSVNLPFIRIMRDIVRHYEARAPLGEEPDAEAARTAYLVRFAEHESQVYLRRFFERYRGLDPEAALDALLEGRSLTPLRLAVILRSVQPELAPEPFGQALRARLPGRNLSDADVESLYARHGPDRFDLPDRGYLARVHPLELWLLAWLREHPGASWEETRAASLAARTLSYRWLYLAKANTRERRVEIVREMDAFEEVLRFWQRLGYPFETITPSYAVAIGSAGDRPSSIAELMGLLVNDGRRLPTRIVETLRFAEATPYETWLARAPTEPVLVLRPEVARAARGLLREVVEAGTGRRARGAIAGADGSPLAVGGKTGTGDHRQKRFGRGGQLVAERAVSRGAAFAFLIGDRHYGVVTAHVAGPAAREYHFTSSLAVQLFRELAPVIQDALAAEPAHPAQQEV